jgi:sugar phosphate isomerase/epimerase
MKRAIDRREFWNQTMRVSLGAAALTSVGAHDETAVALEPLPRVNPRFKGLSLAAYSLRTEFSWQKGRRTDQPLDMLGFLDYCAELGLEAAEITAYFLEQPLGAAQVNAIKRRAFLNGLEISGGAIGNNFSFAPGSEAARAELKTTRTWIDCYADMGAPSIRVFAGVDVSGKLSNAQLIDNVAANLAEALEYAERRGVMLGIENHDSTQHIDTLLKILERIDSPWLGVTWDSANVAPTPDPYRELERIAPYATVAQLKVMTFVDGEKQPADLARLVDILRRAKYSGYLVFEYEEPEDPYQEIPKYLAKLRGILA